MISASNASQQAAPSLSWKAWRQELHQRGWGWTHQIWIAVHGEESDLPVSMHPQMFNKACTSRMIWKSCKTVHSGSINLWIASLLFTGSVKKWSMAWWVSYVSEIQVGTIITYGTQVTKALDHKIHQIPPCLDVAQQLQWMELNNHRWIAHAEPPFDVTIFDNLQQGIASLTGTSQNMHNILTMCYR